ncbi:MAG: choice-of-anchor B family protein [Bacteroidetes Order II. Incertae sedis bacterium]|nr:choice-of-anchor B family protein [Bacteroidetes Order II. bacterium]
MPRFALLICVLCLTPLTTSASESSIRDAYGSSLLMIGEDILVGETSGFSSPGMIHVLRENSRGSWDVIQTFSSSDAEVGDRFGASMVYADGYLVVSSSGALGGKGAVYVFEKNREGNWAQAGRILSKDEVRSGFGSTLAVSGGHVFISAPGTDLKKGRVFVYSASSDWGLVNTLMSSNPQEGAEFGAGLAVSENTVAIGSPGFDTSSGMIELFSIEDDWGLIDTISSPEDAEEIRLGTSLTLNGNRLFASNPRANRGVGLVSVFEQSNKGWKHTSDMKMEGESSGPAFFGAALAFSEDEIWISAPLSNSFSGGVYRFDADSLKPIDSIDNDVEGGRTQFGTAIAIRADVAAIGMPGNDYGLGSAVVYTNSGDGTWQKVTAYNRPVPDLPPISGGEIECADGEANGYGCENVDLVSFIPLTDLRMNRGVRLNDVWGWTDPETGKEYGIIGHMEAAVFIDVSNPLSPVVLGELPRTPGSPGSTWRDMKVFKDFAFIVADGAGQHGMQVFNMGRLRNWSGEFEQYEPDFLYTNIASAHNIVINEDTGFAYTVGNSSGGETCGGALHMIDVNEPMTPTFLGCFNDPQTGNNGSGATHDAQCVIYEGPDSEHSGKEICVGSNGSAISVADVTDKANPIAISQGTYPNSAYVHQGWFTEDHRYFYQNDEGDETGGVVDRTRTMIWDLTDLDEPEMIAEYFGDSNSTDHNLYVKGDFMYQTNNASGLRVIDIHDRANPIEVGFFDTTPKGKNVAGFDGTWSSYPYFKSGAILVTSRREGLFIVRKRELDL